MIMVDLVASHILPGAFKQLPAIMDTPTARVITLAIGLQESELEWRRQRPTGPARGLWQFEEAGGTTGVIDHPSTRSIACDLFERCGYPRASLPATIHKALEHNDVLACGLARLLLWTDPHPLPEIGDVDGAWRLYSDKGRTWSPGKPRPNTWPHAYALALGVLYPKGLTT